jgi:ABC-type lipoprotein export system ATPase subunit
LLDFADRRADRLSGGQQQRVAIARVLAQESRVILADEPVAASTRPRRCQCSRCFAISRTRAASPCCAVCIRSI